MSNKHAATEDEIARIHKSITKVHNIKLDAVLAIAERLIEFDAIDALADLINLKDLSVAQKWVEYNNVAAIAASEDGETELAKKLRKIKEAQRGKIVQFKENGTE
jgi:hypothetical protein